MIEFRGELTGECKKFLLKKQRHMQTTAMSFVLLPFCIVSILAAIFWKPIALAFTIPFILTLILSALPASKGDQKVFMPKRIYIDLEEAVIVHECEKMERFHMLNTVETVEDYGEWYYFIFEFEDRDLYFVCQKDLLTQGTIEEFETLFEEKIVRMY